MFSETYEQGGLQAVQLEDGTTAYIQHMPQSSTILAIQADGTVADLQAEGTIDPDTISVLEQYSAKVKLHLSPKKKKRIAALVLLLQNFETVLIHLNCYFRWKEQNVAQGYSVEVMLMAVFICRCSFLYYLSSVLPWFTVTL